MVKVISLSEQAYRELKKKKTRGESFSDVILRIIRAKRTSILELAGSWAGGDLAEIEEELKGERHAVTSREFDA